MTNPENLNINDPIPDGLDKNKNPLELSRDEMSERIVQDRYDDGDGETEEFRHATWDSQDLMDTCHLLERRVNGKILYQLDVYTVGKEKVNGYVYTPSNDDIGILEFPNYEPWGERSQKSIHDEVRYYLAMGYAQTRIAKKEREEALQIQNEYFTEGYKALIGPLAVAMEVDRPDTQKLIKETKADYPASFEYLASEMYQAFRTREIEMSYDTFLALLKVEIERRQFKE